MDINKLIEIDLKKMNEQMTLLSNLRKGGIHFENPRDERIRMEQAIKTRLGIR